MNDSRKYNIILVDDHALFLSGLKGLLRRYDHCNVIGEASGGREFLEMIRNTPCDVALMDIDMPDMDGMEATAKALEINPNLKVISLSMHGDEEFYHRMTEAGAKGFLLKSSEIDEVTAAIKIVGDGGTYFSQELLLSMVDNIKSSHREHHEEGLSEREKEILILICNGLSNHEIADQLFISKRTVDKHRANILEKTGCKNTANLVVYAIKHSLIEI